MRKDVRTGAAIGGLLLAALVIYAVVNHKHSKTPNSKIVLDTGKATAGGNQAGGVDQPAPSTDGGPVNGTSGHEGPVTPPADAPRTSGPAKPIEDVQIGTGTEIPAGPMPMAGASKSQSWAILLSADHVEDVMKSDRVVPVRHDSNAGDHNVKDNSDRRTTGNTGTRRTPLAEETGTGSPTNGSGSSDRHDRPAATNAKTHRVVEGETFSSIARATYGDAKYFKDIIKANPNVDPNRLRPGTVISLPDKSQFKHDAAPTTGSASAETPKRHSPPSTSTNPKTEYRVQANDNLYKISEKLYHTANRVDAIYQLNKSIIGPDPEKLKLDMVLKLPEPPTETASR